MLLLNLPLEVITEVTVHLDQPSLASFARTSKLVKPLAVEQLYTRPVVRGQHRANAWTRTWDEWVAVKVKKGELSVPKIKELTFEAIKDEPMKVANLRGCIEAGVFDKLTSLKVLGCVVDPSFYVHLFGPSSSLRQKLLHLVIDTFQGGATTASCSPAFYFAFDLPHLLSLALLVDMYDDDEHALLFGDLEEPPWSKQDVYADEFCREIHQVAEPFQERLKLDFDYFTEKHCATVFPLIPRLEDVVLASPPVSSPFTSLKSLTYPLSLNVGEEAYAFLCTNFLPNLQHLTLVGTFAAVWVPGGPVVEYPLVKLARFSTYHSCTPNPIKPATTVHTPHRVLVTSPWKEAGWSRLMAEEAASEAFARYKGPKLETLDLSGVSMVWPRVA